MLAEEGDDLSNIEIPSEESSSSEPPASAKSKEEAPTPAASDTSSSGSTPGQPKPTSHTGSSLREMNGRPLFPSVIRLLHEAGIHDEKELEKIKGTGIRGMIRKGDVLAHLGKVGNAWGTSKKLELASESPANVKPTQAKAEQKVRSIQC